MFLIKTKFEHIIWCSEIDREIHRFLSEKHLFKCYLKYSRNVSEETLIHPLSSFSEEANPSPLHIATTLSGIVLMLIPVTLIMIMIIVVQKRKSLKKCVKNLVFGSLFYI